MKLRTLAAGMFVALFLSVPAVSLAADCSALTTQLATLQAQSVNATGLQLQIVNLQIQITQLQIRACNETTTPLPDNGSSALSAEGSLENPLTVTVTYTINQRRSCGGGTYGLYFGDENKRGGQEPLLVPYPADSCNAQVRHTDHTYAKAGGYTIALYDLSSKGKVLVGEYKVTVGQSGKSLVTFDKGSYTSATPTLTGKTKGRFSLPFGISVDNGDKVYASGVGAIQPKKGKWSHTITTPLADGTYNVRAFTLLNLPIGSGMFSVAASQTPPSTGPQITSFTASPTSISAGASATLSWTVANTDQCGISVIRGNTTGINLTQATVSGNTTTVTTGPLWDITTYEVRCAPRGNTNQEYARKSLTIKVVGQETPRPEEVKVTSFSSAQATSPRQPVALQWASENAQSCDLRITSPSNLARYVTSLATQGAYTVYPTVSTTYNLYCSRLASDGFTTESNDSRNLTVKVVGGETPRPVVGVTPGATPTLSFTGEPNIITDGGSAVLTWATTNALRCILQSSDTGSEQNVAVNGSMTVYPQAYSTSYRLICSNDPGTGKDGPATEKTVVIRFKSLKQYDLSASAYAAIQASINDIARQLKELLAK